jgi:hypothetical protein
MQAPGGTSEPRAFGAGARENRKKSEVGAAGRGVIAARTISTVADYATTGVSGQENVLLLF